MNVNLHLQTGISEYLFYRSGRTLHPSLQRAKILRARRQGGGRQRVPIQHLHCHKFSGIAGSQCDITVQPI